MTLALQATGITRRFPGVLVNAHVNFSREKGEIHALPGENGAGKSTLMNILYDFYQPDEGEICIQDQPVKIIYHSFIQIYPMRHISCIRV